MNEEQFQRFLYSCQSASLKFHFNNCDGIIEYMDKGLEEQNFLEALYRQKNLLDRHHSGFCFTMSAWVFDLLFSMGVNNYYFMESKNSYWSNFVILFEVDGVYRICDLAAEVRKNEELIPRLIDHQEQDELLSLYKKIRTPRFLNITPEEYIKHYPIELCYVLEHNNHENAPYNDVPRASLESFLKRQKGKC